MTDIEANNEVFVAADSAAHAEDWPALWQLRHSLREAAALWVDMYGPLCAVAGWHVDRDAARELLDEVIAAGFHQPELLAEELADTFATEPGWGEREARMRANVPLPGVELHEWPDYEATLEPVLDRLTTDREAELGERLPVRADSAWQTAQQTLDWVSSRWEHANGHVQNRDAVEVLDRVAGGERFACVEYTVVLSQALNALQIPARSLDLMMRDHHTGAARGHVVTEAWIDELRRWVLLDGQNGAWWGEPGEPLGVLELIDRHRAGNRPPMNSTTRQLIDQQQEVWFWYFAVARTTGLAWSEPPFVPVFQTNGVLKADRLVHGSRHVAPDLGRIATSIVDADGPAVAFTPVHPYATGLAVKPAGGVAREDGLAICAPLRLQRPPGDHAYGIATRTPYGTLEPQPLRFTTR